MRTILIAATVLAAFAAGPSLAQQAHEAHHPSAADAAAVPASDKAKMHEMCKAVMQSKMEAKQPHDHGRDKTGAATWPQGKAPSTEEMERMHKQCAAMMQDKAARPAPDGVVK